MSPVVLTDSANGFVGALGRSRTNARFSVPRAESPAPAQFDRGELLCLASRLLAGRSQQPRFGRAARAFGASDDHGLGFGVRSCLRTASGRGAPHADLAGGARRCLYPRSGAPDGRGLACRHDVLAGRLNRCRSAAKSLARDRQCLVCRPVRRHGAGHHSPDPARQRAAHAWADGGHGADAALWCLGLPSDRPKLGRAAQSARDPQFRWHYDFCRHRGQITPGLKYRKILEINPFPFNTNSDRGGGDVDGGGCCVMHRC